MKILSYITLIAAFAFGMNNTNAVASAPNNIDIEAISGGNVQASLNDASEILTLRMVTNSKEHVMVILSGRGGEVIFKEKVVVGDRGAVLEIPMADLKAGIYYLKVKGATLNYFEGFKKK